MLSTDKLFSFFVSFYKVGRFDLTFCGGDVKHSKYTFTLGALSNASVITNLIIFVPLVYKVYKGYVQHNRLFFHISLHIISVISTQCPKHGFA